VSPGASTVASEAKREGIPTSDSLLIYGDVTAPSGPESKTRLLTQILETRLARQAYWIGLATCPRASQGWVIPARPDPHANVTCPGLSQACVAGGR
jgi:hypothetical protein